MENTVVGFDVCFHGRPATEPSNVRAAVTLWAFVIPVILLFVTATVAHFCRASYWPAVRLTFIASAAWLLPYFVVLSIVFRTAAFDWTETFRLALIALLGAFLGAAMSMLIGLVFVADRRIAERSDMR
jgi:hypothetical protein